MTAQPQVPAPPVPAPSQQPRRAVRAAISVLIALHVLAVFIGPWAMPPQTSELAVTCARIFQPYLEIMGLANGYRFFAPEPGPSHLVRYEITRDDGQQIEGVFPDRQQHKPRLLYHRYFMLSEFINTLENPSGPPNNLQAYSQSYAEHLMHEHQAQSIKLYLRRHYIPRMSEVREGMKLTDKRLYEEHPLVIHKPDAP